MTKHTDCGPFCLHCLDFGFVHLGPKYELCPSIGCIARETQAVKDKVNASQRRTRRARTQTNV